MSTAAIASAENAPIVDFLDVVEPASVDLLAKLTRGGIKRVLTGHRSGQFFTDAEHLRLTNHFAAALSVADLIGRARIQVQADREYVKQNAIIDQFAEWSWPWSAKDLAELFTPRAALAFFRKIANIVVEGGAELYATIMEGRAFSLAVTADRVILDKVARVIDNRIETGKDIRGGDRVIEEILDSSGIAHKNGYGEMVSRTNTIEAYNQGSWARFQDRDLDEFFPVWKYVGIKDGRQRQGPEPEKPNHRIKCGKYWPRSVSFFDVRGRTARDVINCRCSFLGKTKRQWAKLEAQGARLETGGIPSWPIA